MGFDPDLESGFRFFIPRPGLEGAVIVIDDPAVPQECLVRVDLNDPAFHLCVPPHLFSLCGFHDIILRLRVFYFALHGLHDVEVECCPCLLAHGGLSVGGTENPQFQFAPWRWRCGVGEVTGHVGVGVVWMLVLLLRWLWSW